MDDVRDVHFFHFSRVVSIFSFRFQVEGVDLDILQHVDFAAFPLPKDGGGGLVDEVEFGIVEDKHGIVDLVDDLIELVVFLDLGYHHVKMLSVQLLVYGVEDEAVQEDDKDSEADLDD